MLSSIRLRAVAVAATLFVAVPSAFAEGPAAARYKASDNLSATHEQDGSPIAPGNLQ